jgi:electron transfer flavoprotein beta subunit
VGPQTAEKLGINQITCVSQIEEVDAEKKTITAVRSIEGGFEKIRAKLPILLTLTDEHYLPRPPSAIKMMIYKNATTEMSDTDFDESYLTSGANLKSENTISLWDIDAIGADPESCGLAGSPTKVKTIDLVVLKSENLKMIENTDEAIGDMVHELIADHTLG